MIKHTYDELIQKLNNGEIVEITFSISDYSHYNNCSIKRHVDLINNSNQVVYIKVKLAPDDSETVSFLGKFKEDHKLFKLSGKGLFTLKQIWTKVSIHHISYTN